ncbi:MAG: M36 family metallopeptidase [Sphingobacteriales bacterium]|nr:M36 family metallopeptidase [Sphingobacteriales bacterium]
MRKVLLLSVLLICALAGFAQVDNQAKNAALQLVRQNQASIKLPSADLNDVKVSSTYRISGSDVTMVYLQQAYKGVPVYNQLKTLAFRGGKVVSDAGEFQLSMEKMTGNASQLPSVSAVNALQAAFRETKVEAKELAIPISILEEGRKLEFGRLGVSSENISSELMWIPNDKGVYRLAWQVFVAPVVSSDYWLIRVDAQTGAVIGKQNLTITCQWDHSNHSVADHIAQNHNKKAAASTLNYVLQRNDRTNQWEYKPFVITTATYRVVKYPAESPQHPGGTPSLHTDPWTLTPGNATSLKWHSDPVDYSTTRGNNVWAQEDRDANNTTFGIMGNSTTALPSLTFNYTYDFTKSPIDPTSDNQQAAIVNLFYMNNLMHDMSYTYGFDEVGGNFQNDNQGRGGAGADYVIADAQDAGGTNNANFATPADGSRPRMQMYLWTLTSPQRDGDLDNGVVSHEYGHGISNRLTGGPANVSCLGNAEQAGEGWSDYMSLMMGTDWSTATINDGVIRRGIGTYVLGQPITGTGIRSFPYSTDMAIYPKTYANLPGSVIPHGVGEIWCMMIWEMTWEIIKQDNYIETNFLNPPGAVSTWRGNAAAMKLVIEGMRLQPCSPGFVQSRDAILQADQVFFGGRYKCSIWKAFAKRGLGRNASQGSNTSINDGVADFSVDSGSFALNPGSATATEGTPLTYTNVVSAGECTAMTNYVLRDTLPTTVTWVSGGVYTPADRVVTFSPITLPINTSQNFAVTVNVNNGTYFAPVQHVNDPVTAIAPNWTAASTTANVWATSGAAVHSAPLAFFSPDPALTSDQTLRTTGTFVLPSGPSAFSRLSFWHRYTTESNWDGCVVEISTNGGGSWSDLGQYMSGARYNATLNSSANPLAGRAAFSGNSGAYVNTVINLAAYAGQTVMFRFRLGSDGSVGSTGWYVDDIVMESAPFVYTKSGLYDAGNQRVSYKDSLTPIAQAVCADPPVVNAPTVTQPTCAGQLTGTIVVNATGIDVLEYSIDGGTNFQASNTFNNLAAGNYNIVVRLVSTPSCLTAYSGNPVVINPLTGTPTITPPTVTQPVCPVLTGTIVVNASGTGTLEYSVNGGSTWQASNTFSGLAAGNYNIAAREQSNPGCMSLYSGNPVTINTVIPPIVVTQPTNKVICQNGNTTFTITDNAPVPAPTYQWQISINGGTTWTNLANVAPFSGVTSTTLTVTGAGLVYSGNLFRCVVSNICGSTNSNSASLTVNPLPVVNSGPSGMCAPVTLTATGNADTYTWSPATGLNTTTGTTVVASPTVSTIYTVTGTITATGCTNSASVTVLGTPVTPVITPAAPVICAGTIQPLTVTPTSFTVAYSGAALTIPSSGTASTYPAVINVTGLPASGVRVKSITLNGLSHTFPSDIDIAVQSPTGTNVVVMSDAGGSADIVNVNVTLDDAAAGLVPSPIVSGTYRPTNSSGPDNFPAPGPGSITQINPPLSGFSGNFNGNWNLFLVDDAGGDVGTMTGWTIVFEVPTAVWSPAAGLFSDASATVPYVAGTAASTVYFKQSPAVTTQYTYTVTNTLGTCSSAPASVTVTVNPLPTISVSPAAQCGPVTLTAAGNSNSYTWSPAAGLSSTTGAAVTANPVLNTTYTVTGSFTATGCTNTATVLVNATPAAPVVTPSSVNICLGSTTTLTVTPTPVTTATTGPIAIPNGAPVNTAAGVASPYPSAINVGGLPATGVRVKSVNINGISHTWPSDIDMLLQAPNGSNVILMSDRGGSVDIVNANLVFDDASLVDLPSSGIVSGTYRPTNTAGPDNFPAPGPGSISQINPRLANFSGNFNGDWKLFINDQAAGDVGLVTSWSITFEITGAVWTPVAGLFTDPLVTIPYTAGTMAGTVYAKPATTTTYSVTRASATCTSAATNVTVTVFQPAAISTQPANQTVCEGANALFSVTATGSSLSYQWQLSTDNGTTWVNIVGANSSTYTEANTSTSQSGRRYRVIISNTCNTVTSNAATLTVNALTPVVATDLWTRRICLSDTLVPLVGTPAGGSWSGIGVSGFNFIPGATAVGTYTLTYTYTNAAGCTSRDTTKVVVSDCPERIRLLRDNAVILYPNPNSGQFFIRMNSVLYNYLSMKVYTTGGQQVAAQDWKGLVYGRVIPINLTYLPAATYMVRFIYDDGVRTAEKTFPVVIGGQ